MLMVTSTPWMALFSLAVSRLRTDSRVFAEIPCQLCEAPLSIHQPDINAPERLLGTCDACGSWHLIDCDRAITVLLPDAVGLRKIGADR